MTALAPSTLRAYTKRLATFKTYYEFSGKGWKHLDGTDAEPKKFDIQEHENNINYIRQSARFANCETRKGYINTLLHFSKQYPDSYKAYHEYFQEVKEECNKRAKEQKLPPARQEKYLTKDELIEAYNTCLGNYLASGNNYYDHLILALYIVQPPVRADYAGMKCLKPDSVEHFLSVDKQSNFAVIDEKSYKNSYFIFQTYKTAKTYGIAKIEMEHPVWEILKEHAYDKRHSEVLPSWYDSKTLAREVSNILFRYTGKECSIGLIRHAWVFDLYKTNPTIKQKEDLAKKMLHSVAVQELYRTAESLEELDINS